MVKEVIFTWSTITLGTYAAIDALSRATVSDVMQKDVSLLSMITGRDEEYFMELPLPELAKLRQSMHEFLNAGIEEQYYPTFECNGRKYKVSETLEEYTGAQLEGVSALRLTDETYPSKAHIVTAILCKEVPTEINVWIYKAGRKFWKKDVFETTTVEPLTIHERAAAFEKHLPSSIAMGINRFFFLCSQELYPLVLGKIKKDTLKLKEMIQMKDQRQASDRKR